MKVAVVILNWNGLQHLQHYLPSVVSTTPDADIVVADNGSTDDSVEWVKAHHPEVKVLIFTGEILNEKLWVDVLDAGACGIEETVVDANAEYYNLHGVKVEKPKKGIFVKKQVGKTTKVVINE